MNLNTNANTNDPSIAVLTGKCFTATGANVAPSANSTSVTMVTKTPIPADRLFKQLKVYIASNWNGCKIERRTALDEVLPRLQCYGQQFGLDVMFVDVQCGAPFDHALDALLLESHLTELEECNQTSSGPCFICLLNERIDLDDALTPVLPVTISAELMNKLRTSTTNDLLDRWYQKSETDGNYALCSVSDAFPQLLNPESEKHGETVAAVRKEQSALVELLSKHVTLKSAIETEVDRALLICPSKSVFVFHGPITSKSAQPANGSASGSVVQCIKQRVMSNAALAESVITLRSSIDSNAIVNSDATNSEPSDDDADEVVTFQRSLSDQLFSRLLRIVDVFWSKSQPQNDSFSRLIKRFESRNFSTHLGYKLLNNLINYVYHEEVLPRRADPDAVSCKHNSKVLSDARLTIQNAAEEHLSSISKLHSPINFTLVHGFSTSPPPPPPTSAAGASEQSQTRVIASCQFLPDLEVAQQFHAAVKQSLSAANKQPLFIALDAEGRQSHFDISFSLLAHLETLFAQPASADGRQSTNFDAVPIGDQACFGRLNKRLAEVSRLLQQSRSVLVISLINVMPSHCDALASELSGKVPPNVVFMSTTVASRGGSATNMMESSCIGLPTQASATNDEVAAKTVCNSREQLLMLVEKIDAKFNHVGDSSHHAFRLIMQLLTMNIEGIDECRLLHFLRQSTTSGSESHETYAVWLWHTLKLILLRSGLLQMQFQYGKIVLKIASPAMRDAFYHAYLHVRSVHDPPDTFRWLHRNMLTHLYQVDELHADTPKRDSSASTKTAAAAAAITTTTTATATTATATVTSNHAPSHLGGHRSSHLGVLKALPKISSFDADEIFEARSKKRRSVAAPLQYGDGEYNVLRLQSEWFHFVHAKSFDEFTTWFTNVFSIDRLVAIARTMSIDSLLAMLQLVLKHFFVSDVHVLRLVLESARRVLTENPSQLPAEIFLHANHFMSLLQGQNGTTPRSGLLSAILQQSVQFYEKCDDQIAFVPLSSWVKPIVPQFDVQVESAVGSGAAALLQDNQHLFWITDNNRCITKFSLASGESVKCLEKLTDKQFTCLIISQDDTKLYVGATDCTVRQYSTKNEELQHIFTGHRDAVTCVAVTLDGKLVCSGSKDKTVRIYNAMSRQLVSSTPVHDGSVRCVLFSKSAQLAITGGADFKVKVWFIEDMTLMHVFEEYVTPITAIALTPDTSFLLVACEDRRLSVKSLISGKDVHELETIQEYATTLSVSSDCHHVAVGCADGATYIYNLRTMDLIQRIAPPLVSVLPSPAGHTPSLHRSSVCSGAPSQDAVSPASATAATTVATATATTAGSSASQPNRGLARAMSVASPVGPPNSRRVDGSTVSCIDSTEVSCSAVSSSNLEELSASGVAGGGRIEGFPCRSCESELRRCAMTDFSFGLSNSDAVKSVQFTRCGQHVLVTQRGCVRLVRVQLPSFMQQFVDSFQHARRVTCVCLSRDGRVAATGSDDNIIKLWNLLLCDFALNLVGHDGGIETMQISNDEQFLVSAGRDRRCIVWHAQTGRIFLKYTEHEADVMQLALFGEDDEYGIRCVSLDAAGVSKLWRIDTGETFVTLKNLQFSGLPIAITSNFQLAIGSASASGLAVCMLADGRVVQQISHKERITCFTLSKDSQYVITGSVDTSLKVWHTRTGRLTQVLAEHEQAIACVALTDNNQRVVSGSHDCTAIIWDLSTGAVCTKLAAHSGPVTQVRITHDTNIVLTASLDKTVRAWSMHSGSQLSWFYVHYPVVDMQMTFDASRIVLRFERSCNLAMLSLRVTEKLLERLQQETPKPAEAQPAAAHGPHAAGATVHTNPRVKLQRSMTMPANVIQPDPSASGPGAACLSYRHRQSPFKQTTLLGMFKEQEKNRQQRLQSLLRRPDAWLLGSRVSIGSNRSSKATSACTLL